MRDGDLKMFTIGCSLCNDTQIVNAARCPECTGPSDEELQTWADNNKSNGWKWFTEEKPPIDRLIIVAIGGNYWVTSWYNNPGYQTYNGYINAEAGFENLDCDDSFIQCEGKEVLWRFPDFKEVI